MKETDRYSTEIADDISKYEGLRTLWCEVFNDEPDFVDDMYSYFGAAPAEGVYSSKNIKGYVTLNDRGEVVSALTCFRCGDLGETPAYTSYAICTDPKFRRLGLAGRLVEYVRDIVIEGGGISVISPAEPSLEKFYSAHGYSPFFYAENCEANAEDEEVFNFDDEDAEYEKLNPALNIKRLSAEEYNDSRESFLSRRPHIKISEEMMSLIYNESKLSDGSSGCIQINKGDAICTLSEKKNGGLEIAELLINPKLEEFSSEIAGEIAGRISAYFGQESILYRTPGAGYCQSMIAGLSESNRNIINETECEAYYGFPID